MIGVSPGVSDPPAREVREVDPEHRSFERVSGRGPALVVLGLAVLIVVIGGVASALLSGNAPTVAVHQVELSDGTVVHLTTATKALHSIVGSGEPPADIIGNLAVPAGSSVTGTVDSDQSGGTYDRTVSMTRSTLDSTQLVGAFRSIFHAYGWQVIYVGAGARGGPGTEVLAKRGSGDGYYWEAGVVVSPSTAAGVTPFSLELFQTSDGS